MGSRAPPLSPGGDVGERGVVNTPGRRRGARGEGGTGGGGEEWNCVSINGIILYFSRFTGREREWPGVLTDVDFKTVELPVSIVLFSHFSFISLEAHASGPECSPTRMSEWQDSSRERQRGLSKREFRNSRGSGSGGARTGPGMRGCTWRVARARQLRRVNFSVVVPSLGSLKSISLTTDVRNMILVC